MAKLFGVIDTVNMDYGYEFERQTKILYEKRAELSEKEFLNYVKSLATWSCYADRIMNMPAATVIRHHALNIIKAQDDLDVELELILNALGYTAEKQNGEWVLTMVSREVKAEVWQEAEAQAQKYDLVMATPSFGLPEPLVAEGGWEKELVEDKDIKDMEGSVQDIVKNVMGMLKKG